MGKSSGVVWECQNCGSQFPKWTGQCPECQKWNSLVETAVSTKFKVQSSKFKVAAQNSKPQTLSEILKTQVNSSQRFSTGIGELDRVLGGGLVPGEVVLLAGEPGMGKSTLLSRVALQMAQKLNLKSQISNLKSEAPSVLYVCGEESPGQVALRLQRLSRPQSHLFEPEPQSRRPERSASRRRVEGSSQDALSLLSETDVDAVVDHLERPGPPAGGPGLLVIIDSIQTLTTDDLTGVAGSVGQVRESAGRLMQVAKRLDIPIFLVGHVTKDGTVAGPKVLEHMVDAVLVLEGERSGNFRILRAVKNRFGAVDEVGLFAMDNGDMKEVINPGELLLGGAAGKVPGSVLGCTLEGLRPLILEVQALAVPSKLAVPRRVGQGISERKLQVLCAVIERYVNRKLGDMDIFVSIAGGLTSSDPGLDLAVVGAVISSLKEPIGDRRKLDDRRLTIEDSGGKSKIEDGKSKADQSILNPLSSTTTFHLPSSTVSATNSIFCGEVGLLGEIRQVQGWERREKEVKRLGMGQLVGANRIRNIRELQGLL